MNKHIRLTDSQVDYVQESLAYMSLTDVIEGLFPQLHGKEWYMANAGLIVVTSND